MKNIEKLFTNVGVAVFGSLWALEWVRQNDFWQIDGNLQN